MKVRIAPLATGTQVPYRGEPKPELPFHLVPSPGVSPRVSPSFPAGQEVACAGPAGACPVRRRARRVDRQRRAAVDRHRPEVRPGRPVVGRQLLHALLRRLPAARRSHGRPPRSTAHVRRRPHPLRAGLAGRRPRHLAGHADRRSRGPGPRRRAALPGRAVARHRDVRRGRRAQQGAGRLGRGRRLRRRRRRAARRHPDRVRRLGVGAVRQRADRPGRGVLRARACCRRAATRARATSTSPAPCP